MSESLAGVIDRITFHNLESGYAILRVTVSGHRDSVTIVGKLPQVVAGEYVEAEGEWVFDRDHGKQFKADLLRTNPPHTTAGIVKYLGSGLIRGIGPAYAKRIVEIFGDKTLEIIDQSPMNLSEVKGIGPSRLARIRKSWDEQKGVRAIMVFLNSYGIGTNRAIRIYRQYGDQAIELVKSNPYRLTTDIWGIGFQIADDLAVRLGVPFDSPHRARAAVRHALQQRSDKGDVGYPERGIVELTGQLTKNIPEQVILDAIESGRVEDEFVRDTPPEPVEPVGIEPWLFTRPMFMSELGVARSIMQLRQGGHPLPDMNVETALTWVQTRIGFELAKSQKAAIRSACTEKVLIVTGGPGVGKTTIVKGLLEIFSARQQRVALCAPTGRAAKRLSESTGKEAKTIHRLLEFDPGLGQFRRNREHPMDIDLLVVDESSMVDITLMNQLLRAVPPWAALILVGDIDQLPSVGPGCVLKDMIESEVLPVVRLTEIFRQAETSWIVRAAHAINSGKEPQSAPPGGQGDFYFVEADDPDAIIEKMTVMIRDRIPSRFGLDPRKDVQILSPMQKSALGVENLNRVFQNLLNPASGGKQVERFGTSYRVGDKIIQTRNNYQKEVYNGDIGRITAIDDTDQEILAEFDGREVPYEYGELDELSLAYATTIHKSQGSEYAAIVIPLHTQHFVMLQRNLLYTGITRGKKLVVVVGSRKAMWIATQTQDIATRFSLLKWRLRKLHEAGNGESTER